MSKLYFCNVDGIGELFLDRVLLEFEQGPVLFTCKDVTGDLFLCLCSEIRSEQKWIVSKCELETLRELVGQKIDILSAICRQKQLTVITRNPEGEETSDIIDTEEVDPLDLPKNGVYMRFDQGWT